MMRLDTIEIDREVTALGTLTLHRYEAQTGESGYEIRIDDQFLMATHGAHGERVMAAVAHERLLPAAGADLAVLVGGLGAGHTLRAALDLPGVRAVQVVEIGAKLVEWNRAYFSGANGQALDDPRVTVVVADLAAVLRDRRGCFDLLLLDVDNGPGWLAAAGNARLYQVAGLRDCSAALRPGGVLAVWSPSPNAVFAERLTQVFAHVERVGTQDWLPDRSSPEAPALGDVIYLARAAAKGVTASGDRTASRSRPR